MKLTKILSAAAMAGLIAGAAHAQSIPDIGGLSSAQVNPGDLALGFYNPAVTGGNLVVDVGPASDYYSTTNALASENNAVSGGLVAGTTYTVNAYNPVDLTSSSTFGSNAYSSSTQWAVVGGNGNDGGPGAEPNQTLWLTGSSLTAKVQSQQGQTSINLDTMVNGLTGSSQAPGGGSPDATFQAKSPATSFSSLGQPNGSFGYSEGALTKTTAGAATGSVSLELYELNTTDNNTTGNPNTVDLGTFTLSSTSLTFTPFAAIPEPSTYAAILGALTVGFVIIRRRTQAGFNLLA